MAETDAKSEHTVSYSISAESKTATHTVIEARDFEFSVDEPTNVGGTNAGPNPVEYMLGALAGCLNVVGHTVAEEMGITVRNIAVSIEGDLDPRKFMGRAEEPRAGYQDVRVDLTVDSPADEATLADWLETVESRCPVSDNFQNPTPVSLSVTTE
ncbi:OsmC family protein [Halodesulfurarchaeum sp. HSR-GB]|uniref:OsmC family protein n=1 Tax=Halodesulfurarchaeum sp. HSR-GB TaxID=3074077 RepID=UPI0028679680|nr:OsmC family protein [Halodesulfurarchaeum sp. HSR-GB]MDR5656174.1 OsmC family protein [Halodesulfurarchaeum sp. HSR-GB]